MTRNKAKKIIYGVGGKAFPNDYNWICSKCGNENRAWEMICPYCAWELEQKK